MHFGSSRRAAQRARLNQNNEEYRRNQRERRPKGGISGILVVRGREQRSRRSFNIVARRGGGTDCAPHLALRLKRLVRKRR